MSPDESDPARARVEAWQIVLDRLELDVIRVERAVADGAGLSRPLDDWHAPEGYGPLPAELRGPAQEILARQQDAVRRLAAALRTTRAHQAYVTGGTRADGPVYLDVGA